MLKAGWEDPFPRIRYCKGETIEIDNNLGKSYRFCKPITAHIMRRKAITTLLLPDMDETTVRQISGQVDNFFNRPPG